MDPTKPPPDSSQKRNRPPLWLALSRNRHGLSRSLLPTGPLKRALEGGDGESGAEPLMIATVNDEVGKTRMVGRELTVESTMKDAVYYVQFSAFKDFL